MKTRMNQAIAADHLLLFSVQSFSLLKSWLRLRFPSSSRQARCLFKPGPPQCLRCRRCLRFWACRGRTMESLWVCLLEEMQCPTRSHSSRAGSPSLPPNCRSMAPSSKTREPTRWRWPLSAPRRCLTPNRCSWVCLVRDKGLFAYCGRGDDGLEESDNVGQE